MRFENTNRRINRTSFAVFFYYVMVVNLSRKIFYVCLTDYTLIRIFTITIVIAAALRDKCECEYIA